VAHLALLQVSIAKPLQGQHPDAYLGVLCATSSAGIALLSSARASGPHQLVLWPNITISLLNFCTVVLFSHSSPSVVRGPAGGGGVPEALRLLKTAEALLLSASATWGQPAADVAGKACLPLRAARLLGVLRFSSCVRLAYQ